MEQLLTMSALRRTKAEEEYVRVPVTEVINFLSNAECRITKLNLSRGNIVVNNKLTELIITDALVERLMPLIRENKTIKELNLQGIELPVTY